MKYIHIYICITQEITVLSRYLNMCIFTLQMCVSKYENWCAKSGAFFYQKACATNKSNLHTFSVEKKSCRFYAKRQEITIFIQFCMRFMNNYSNQAILPPLLHLCGCTSPPSKALKHFFVSKFTIRPLTSPFRHFWNFPPLQGKVYMVFPSESRHCPVAAFTIAWSLLLQFQFWLRPLLHWFVCTLPFAFGR